MITGIAIENFKGIRDRVEIDLRPITLLFGPNSAGKSSISHAVHLAREVFERHNVDPDRTISGGDFVDLGGFQNFVHGHDLDRVVKLGFTLDVELSDLTGLILDATDVFETDPGELFFTAINSAHVEISLAWSQRLGRPFVREYEVSFDGESFARLIQNSGRPAADLSLNLRHSSLRPVKECTQLEDWFVPYTVDDLDVSGLDEFLVFTNSVRSIPGLRVDELAAKERSGTAGLEISGQSDALPDWQRYLRFDFDHEAPVDLQEQEEAEMTWLSRALFEFVVMPGRILTEQLTGFRYLGPLRQSPERNSVPPRYPDPARWASGLGAWDLLQEDDARLCDEVSDWLSGNDKLEAGYQLERKNYKELDLSDPLVVQLLTGRAFDEADNESQLRVADLPTQTRIVIVPVGSTTELRPHDVGIGISQVVPVLVTALAGHRRLLAIEQPELHLHPKLQAELADLFVASAKGNQQHIFLLETHSELLPLRLMRRIRESAIEEQSKEKASLLPQDVAIYYIEVHDGATIATQLELGDQGQLLDPWPEGFFEEGFRERFSE